MRGNARILVIGSDALGTAVARALPRCQAVTVTGGLRGLWTAGQSAYDGIVVSLDDQTRAARLLRSLREVLPQTRIVVAGPAAREPEVQAAVAAGADDYVLEPVAAGDLHAALGLPAAPRAPAQDLALPAVPEIVQLGEVLKQLSAGLEATLERLATLLQRAFEAAGVTMQVEELTTTAGRPAPPVLEEPLRRQERVIGFIALGQRVQGSYTTADAARLADYARLIETIAAQAHERALWQELAWRDDLSGLRNRRYFEQRLDELLQQATAQRSRVTVLLFDIDDFKSYNDAYGHATGDALLREVAALLLRCSREHDVVARYGGDEFTAILWDAEQPRIAGSQHPSDPAAVAARFQDVIRAHAFQCLGAGAPGPVTLSAGLACFPWDGRTRSELLCAADAALLTAKRSGKNRVQLAEPTATSAPTDAAPAD